MKIGFIIGLLFALQTFAETYQQACRVIGEDDYVQYQIEADPSLQKNSHFNLKLTAFEDENCTVPYLQYNQYFKVADFESGKLNLKTTKISYSALSDQISEALNMIQYCGISDWQTNLETTVTGQLCDDYQQLTQDQILFQILQTADGQLQIGKLSSKQNGRSEKQRPIEWEELKFHSIKSPLKHFN